MTTEKTIPVDKSTIDLCFFRISGVSVAFDASLVSEFMDQDDEVQRTDTVDVGQCLGLDTRSKDTLCQKALMNRADQQYVLLLGPQIRIEPVEISKLFRLPLIVRAIEGLTGICGIVLQRNDVSYLLDVDSLISCQ
jgi:hypothetical protein